MIRAVLREGHDLVMKPAEDPNWFDRLFGTDDMYLLRECLPVTLAVGNQKKAQLFLYPGCQSI